MRSLRIATLACAIVTTLRAAPTLAAVYSFVDKEGVLHLTNISDDPRSRPYPLEGKENTFTWRDDLGKMQKVHRTDVTRYDDLIIEAARYYSLPPALVKAVIAVESSFEAAAVSHAGAQGLMQLIPSTARAMHVIEPFDCRDNVYGGARYLRVMANHFDGNVRLTVAAYNAGPKNVENAGGAVPAIDETQRYVRRVLALYRHYLSTWKAGAR
ncbi:MAG: hypothetical protein A2289_25945 [Deltaproteobacteria bacterium RIFOXYA12_FULL_58_15]|nr:MAG: hypothetical protein A2289_25945 [Deltaproteobacteria bacterium RIFOXYA12_FULL_58_15]OGR11650.1 MAG: hypothetical protein A2341_02750 [Deltaproteobacteria bacterium RIFOXYB12_FULL_58_9]